MRRSVSRRGLVVALVVAAGLAGQGVAAAAPAVTAGSATSTTSASTVTDASRTAAPAAPSGRPGTVGPLAGAAGRTAATRFTAGRRPAGTGSDAVRPADLASINCLLNVQYPHGSHHVPGNANVVATIDCNLPVTELLMTVELYFWNGTTWVLVGGPDYFYSANSPSLRGNSAAPCINGIYVGAASGLGVAPYGYYPPTATAQSYSPPVTVDDC
jgi:hypothetical protein